MNAELLFERQERIQRAALGIVTDATSGTVTNVNTGSGPAPLDHLDAVVPATPPPVTYDIGGAVRVGDTVEIDVTGQIDDAGVLNDGAIDAAMKRAVDLRWSSSSGGSSSSDGGAGASTATATTPTPTVQPVPSTATAVEQVMHTVMKGVPGEPVLKSFLATPPVLSNRNRPWAPADKTANDPRMLVVLSKIKDAQPTAKPHVKRYGAWKERRECLLVPVVWLWWCGCMAVWLCCCVVRQYGVAVS